MTFDLFWNTVYQVITWPAQSVTNLSIYLLVLVVIGCPLAILTCPAPKSKSK